MADHKDPQSKRATSTADNEIVNHETIGLSSKGKFMFEKFVNSTFNIISI